MTDSDNQPPSKRAREALKLSVQSGESSFFENSKWFYPEERVLRAIDTATSTLLDEIKARVSSLRMKLRPNQDVEERHWARAHNAAIDEALAAIDTIQGRE